MTLLAGASATFGFLATQPRLPLGEANQALLTGRRPADRRALALRHYDDAGNPSPPPSWAAHAHQELQRLVDLPAGWDGHRAKPVTEAAVQAVVRVLAEVMTERTPFPQYFPLPDGGLQVEWHADGHDIEIEADARGAVYVLATQPESEMARVDAQLDSTAADTAVLPALRSALRDLPIRTLAGR